MSTILDEIAQKRTRRIEAEKRELPLPELKRRALSRPPALNAVDALAKWPKGKRAIIAEVKRRSPSKGELAPNLDPGKLAASYEAGGAYAVSCLVEPDYFGGGLADLAAVRKAVSIPVLYKDFIVDPYQLWQAGAWGADMALLIAALLGERLGEYLQTAGEAGVTPLVEVHDEEETRLALKYGAKLIGINNRNLKTFEISLSVSERLLPLLPPGVLSVAESGLFTAADLARLQKAGANAFLIGESLVKAENPAALLKELSEGEME